MVLKGDCYNGQKVVRIMVVMELKNRAEVRILIAETGKSLRGFSAMIGVSQPYLSQILSGKQKPSATVAYKIARGLGVNIEDIFLIKLIDTTVKA